MMVSMSQVENGVAKFIDNELAPKIPADGANGPLKRFAFLVGITYGVRGKLSSMLESMGAIDADRNVDLDGVVAAMRARVPEAGLRVQVPMVSELVFYPADVDLLHRYIMNG